MEKKQLGNGVKVSDMCLGTMFFGTKVSKEMSLTLLDMYAEAGGMFLDTANMYAHFYSESAKGGDSENVLGEWMKARQNSSRMFVATKVGIPYPGVERGLKPDQIIEECDKSLKRLQIETIDLYYAHFDDRKTPMEEVLGTFQKLIEQGKIRYIAASNYRSWRLEKAKHICEQNNWINYSCIQNNYTYLFPKGVSGDHPQIKINDDMKDYCTQNNIPILAYGALAKGAYARNNIKIMEDYAGKNYIARYQSLLEVAGEKGITPNQVVLCWMKQSTTPVVIPIITASRPEHMKENLVAENLVLENEFIEKLDEAN